MSELEGSGTFMRRKSDFAVRVTIQGRKRKVFALFPKSEAAARERAQVVCDLAAALRREEKAHTRDGIKLLELAALANPRMLKGAQSAVKALLAGELEDESTCPTFAEVAADWTSGKLHKEHPDHVKKTDAVANEIRLRFICGVDLGGTKFGEMPLDMIRVEHCEEVMRQLPATSKRPGSRRHYGQVMSRVLSLAAFPLRLIEKNPLPAGFLPQVGRPPAFPYLYPADDRALLGCTGVPLGRRVYWGFVAREGGRKGETALLQVRDFDLVRGIVRVDDNKTDDPRSWVLTPGVPEALRAWVRIARLKPTDRMFRDEVRKDFVNEDHAAELLRADLERAGVKATRPEIFERSVNRRPMRMHDLRGTFVTLSLAAGQSETWVADRTGHKSSTMINRYRRRAREAGELHLGVLDRLDLAIPELRDPASEPSGTASQAGGALTSSCPILAHVDSNFEAASAAGTEENAVNSGVPKEGLEPPRPSRAVDFESGRASREQADPAKTADFDDAGERRETPRGQDLGKTDPVEAALAEALTLAAKSSDWAAVSKLADELKARRLEREALAPPVLGTPPWRGGR